MWTLQPWQASSLNIFWYLAVDLSRQVEFTWARTVPITAHRLEIGRSRIKLQPRELRLSTVPLTRNSQGRRGGGEGCISFEKEQSVRIKWKIKCFHKWKLIIFTAKIKHFSWSICQKIAKNQKMYCWNFAKIEFGAVQRVSKIVDLEKSEKMRLLSLS